jgi:hypothetical protein
VTVWGAEEQLGNLTALVQNSRMPNKTALKLEADLAAANNGLLAGDYAVTCVGLATFLSDVQAAPGNQISWKLAEQFVTDATRIQLTLGC